VFLQTSSYGIYATDAIPLTGTKPIELLRLLPTLHHKFSSNAAVNTCQTSNPEFYDQLSNMVRNGIASTAPPVHQDNLIHSICLAVQILVVSNDSHDADLKPYLDLLASNSYPHNRHSLPHTLMLDSHVDPDTYADNDSNTAPAFDINASSNINSNSNNNSNNGVIERTQILGWLKNTSLYHALFVRKRLYNNISRGLFRGNAMNKTNFDYSMGIILSRAISGTSGSLNQDGTALEEGKLPVPLTLLPFLDFCNHSSQPNAEHVYNSDMVMRLYSNGTKPIEAGDEITIGYGDQRDSLSFLSVYGFCPRESQFRGEVLPFNIADTLQLKFSINKQDPNGNGNGIIANLHQQGQGKEKDNSDADIADVNLRIPLVVLFSQDVELISDALNTNIKERMHLFRDILANYLMPFYNANADNDGIGSHIHDTEHLLNILKQQHNILLNTKFYDRIHGNYLCKSLSEEKFLDDCQYYVDTQATATGVLVKAVQGYLFTMNEAIEVATRKK
jgi:hypothetical protein